MEFIRERKLPSYEQALEDLERMRNENDKDLVRCKVTIVRRIGGPGKNGKGETQIDFFYDNYCNITIPKSFNKDDKEIKIGERTFAKVKRLLKLYRPILGFPIVDFEDLNSLVQ